MPPVGRYGGIEIVGVRGRAGVVIATPLRRPIRIWPRGQYAVRKKGAWLSALGAGDEVVPAADGGSVWVKRYARLRRAPSCTLRQVRLDGRVMRAPRAFRCALTIYPGGALGLRVSTWPDRSTRVIDPVTGRTVFRTRSPILAIAGREVVLEERSQDRAGEDFGLLESATGAERRIEEPSTGGALESSFAVSPPLVALGFASPIGRQVWDVWVLNTETATLTELPDMPAFVAVKRANMAWTRDGRLVLLAESVGKDVVAVWRPGQKRLKVKTVRLPGRRNAGSDTFAILGS